MRRSDEDVAALAGKRVLVLGDVMLDTFVYGHCTRISPEAPIPVLAIERRDEMAGGAGNVARNVAALGGRAMLIGVIGEDAAGAVLRESLSGEAGIVADLVVDSRPTTQKTRYVAGGQQLLRTDVEQSQAADPAPLLAAFERHLADADAVVLSDYAKGVLTPALLARVIAAARRSGKPVIADPKSADVARYDGVTILTPNVGEAMAAAGMTGTDDAAVAAAGRRLLERMPATDAVLVTRGARGMSLVTREGAVEHHAALAREVFDVSGAGDTVVATLILGLAAGLDASRATRLANVAAGRAVRKSGTAVVTADELAAEVRTAVPLAAKVVSADQAVALADRWRQRGERVGFTNGCFDLIHPGHVALLAQARGACDRLVVGLNTDASVARLKGASRPVQPQDARATVLSSLSAVDLVILFDEDAPLRLIEAIGPDVLVKGSDYSIGRVVGADVVLGRGGRVILADTVDGQSTTGIIERLSR